MDDLKELLWLLEERLVQHDENRKKTQDELKKECSKIRKDADSLEEKIGGEVGEDLKEKEEQILSLIEKLSEGKDDTNTLIKEIQKILLGERKYEIKHMKKAKSFACSYELKVSVVKAEKEIDFNNTELIPNQLQEHLNRIHEYATTVQEKLTEICNKKRKEGGELETRINGKLEELFKEEDARIQAVVKEVKEKIGSSNFEEAEELTRKARLTLLKNQKYSLKVDLPAIYDLKVIKEASLKAIDFEERKLTNLIPLFTKKGEFSLSFTFFDEDEVEALKEVDSPFEVEVEVWEKDYKEDTSRTITKKLTLGSGGEPIFLRSTFTASTAYCLKMRIVHQGMNSQWSDEAEFTTPEFKDLCVWKECPDNVEKDKKYTVGKMNPRVATKVGDKHSTIIGNTFIPLSKATSWNAAILKTKRNGYSIFIGVAPSDINQNEDRNWLKCGWYFDCYRSELYSGPPHNCGGKEYGARKERGEYVHEGEYVGVVMDTTKGELSFALNGVNLGVAYEGIPLDKPLVPCVLLYHKNDSVELVF